MASHCSCGSPLPGGASFCPRCGRPLAPGIGQPEEPAESVSTPVADSEKPPAHGREAYLRAAFLPALGATLARFTVGVLNPVLALLSYLFLAAAGFIAVRLFQKRNNVLGSVWMGCGLGALTGLFCFLPSLLLQLSTLAVQGREGYLGAIQERAGDFPMTAEMVRILEQPGVFAMVIAFGLALEGLLVLASSVAGGALAARRSQAGLDWK